MEIDEISKLFFDNIANVMTPSKYKNTIRKDNNLGRFDILNRMLIEIQSNNAYDVRTADEWELEGRSIKKGAKPIYIVIPMYTHKYIDKNNDKEVKSDDLTLDEVNAALKYGLIERVDKLETSYVKSAFDIRQTRGTQKYNITRPIIKASKLIKLLADITGCKIEVGDITYYSKSSNIFTVSKQSYKELSINIVDILVDYTFNNVVKQIEKENNTEFSEYDNELIKNTIQYSLDTFFMNGRQTDFDIVRHTNIDRLILILNVTDSIIFNIINNVEYTDGSIKNDISKNIDIIKKAEALLDIMEANNINKKMKGI